MKRLVKIKVVVALLLGLATIGTVGAGSALASNDKWGYSFTIKANQANSHSGKRYRQTTNTDNRWKVNLQSSNEKGKGTYTRFWLENNSNKNVSPSQNVKEDGGSYYKYAYSSASRKYVRLTAEDNSYKSETYHVSGYWDEETN